MIFFHLFNFDKFYSLPSPSLCLTGSVTPALPLLLLLR